MCHEWRWNVSCRHRARQPPVGELENPSRRSVVRGFSSALQREVDLHKPRLLSISSSFQRLRAGSLACAVFALAMLPAQHAHAQDPTVAHPARFDPSDVYFQGYLATRAAERLQLEEDFVGAWEKYREADRLF